MARKRFLHRDDRGATAIEYAIIGALIGIGLISSLVGTRSSLSAIFGTASSQMGSANGDTSGSSGSSGSQPAAANPVTSQRAIASPTTSSRYSYWSAKTLTGKTVTNPNANSQATKFTYADGSTSTYLVTYDNSGKLLNEQMTTTPWEGESGRKTDTNVSTFGADGTLLSMNYTNRNADGTVQLVATVNSSNWQSEQVTFYNSNGTVSNQINNYNDPGVPPSMQKSIGDEIYFRALANQ